MGGSRSTPASAEHRHTQRPNHRRRAGQAHEGRVGQWAQGCLSISTRNAVLRACAGSYTPCGVGVGVCQCPHVEMLWW